jgi:hypothetical protein
MEAKKGKQPDNLNAYKKSTGWTSRQHPLPQLLLICFNLNRSLSTREIELVALWNIYAV